MDYHHILNQCEEPEIATRVIRSLQTLFDKDVDLLNINVSEETIASRLARYLEYEFPDFNVDVEYNRMGDAPKKVAWNERPEEVYPDIIVHRRRTNNNVLAIELKKDSNRETKHRDIRKLAAYREELGYKCALFLRLGTAASAGEVVECEWV